ncbi:hypothetical protein H4R34_001474, partial [Dimargaris verticillata]
AITVVNNFIQGSFQNQIDSDGGQPRELKRVDSFDYATMNLGFLLVLGQLSESMGHTIWDKATAAKTTIQDAVDYFLPYASGQAWKGGKGAEMAQATHYFQLAAALYGDSDQRYLKAIKAIGKTSRDESNYHRLYSDYSYGLTSETLRNFKVSTAPIGVRLSAAIPGTDDLTTSAPKDNSGDNSHKTTSATNPKSSDSNEDTEKKQKNEATKCKKN